MTQSAGVLVLEDGSEFPGFLFGGFDSRSTRSLPLSYGEAVFNTSMTGYQEILTDPSYFGQIICMTVPHVGNTGMNHEDVESSRVWCAGFVVQELCKVPSNWRSTQSLEEYLREHQIPGLHGVDTRTLTRHLRTNGAIRGLILPLAEKDQARELFRKLPSFEGRDFIAEVSTPRPYFWKKPAQGLLYRVVVLDFGVKRNQLCALEERGCDIEVVPAKTSAQDILDRKPDGGLSIERPGRSQSSPLCGKDGSGAPGESPDFWGLHGASDFGFGCGSQDL